MELKPSEVGPIPHDWDVISLGELGEALIGLTYKPSDVRQNGTLVLRSSNIQNDALAFEDNVFVSCEVPDRIMVQPGDVLICVRNGSRNLIGKTALLDVRTRGMTFGAFMAVYRSPVGPLINYMFQSRVLKRQIAEHLGATINQITNKSLRSFVVPISPHPEEREAIVRALGDIDALLERLDRLIAKKSEVRNATKRQLLAGQTRLPGFKDQWEESSFANVVRHHAGNSTLIKGKLPSSEAAGLYPAYSASGQDVWCAHFEHEGNAVVVSAVGSRCGKAFAASGKWSAIANTHVVWPLTSKIDPDFLGFFINDENFWLKSGTGQPFVLFTQTFARPLLLPPLKEQTAIARVLSDMDAELTALEARRDKTKNLKQAMMQELLTGKTRLVKGGARG